MLKKFSLLSCLVLSTAALTSCGGGDIGGGVGEFTTVNASATAKTNSFESDIVTSNTCSDTGVSTGGTVETDNIDVDFTSTAQFTTGALNLAISKITVRYTPAPGGTVAAPALPDSFFNFSQLVAPNTTATIPVPIFTRDQKLLLLNRATQAMPTCTGTTFKYYVDIIFEVSEPGGNGKVKSVTAKTNLDIADSI